MKKLYLLFVVTFGLLSGLLTPSAQAVPMGWYTLSATWDDGQFNGKFLYDGSQPNRIASVSGTLSDTLRTTAINQVFAPEDPLLESWVFFANTNPDLLLDVSHDAGFFLTVRDLGASLTLDLSGQNELYDFPGNISAVISGSALRTFSIAPSAAVPEPGSMALLLTGLLAGVLTWRRPRDKQSVL